MDRYIAGEVICIAAPGVDACEIEEVIVGTMQSRDGAELKYTQNDIELFIQRMPTYGAHSENKLAVIKLVDPNVSEVQSAISSATKRLKNAPADGGRKKIIHLVYAGHGSPSDGAWVLKDGCISGEDAYSWITTAYIGCADLLHIDLTMDSCYSSRFLIDILVASQANDVVYPYDCYVSSLPDEKSWEFEFLEHGAMTYCLNNTGNAHVDSNELARAIDERDHKIIAKALQGIAVPNPVAFITNGKQHSVELVSGHFLQVIGAGSIPLIDSSKTLSHSGLSNVLYRAKVAYGANIQYT